MPRDFSRSERRKRFPRQRRHGEGGGGRSREGRKSTRINLVRDYHYDLLWETARDYEIARNTNRPRVDSFSSRLMIPFCLPSLVSSNAYAYFLRALDIVASFYVYIYIYTRSIYTYILPLPSIAPLRPRLLHGEKRAPIETNYSRRICRSWPRTEFKAREGGQD